MRITLRLERNVNVIALAVVALAVIVVWQANRLSKLETEVKIIKATQTKSATYVYPIDQNLLNAVILVESGGNPNAYNKSSGAVGLMQITPIIYKKICGLTKQEAFHPVTNMKCGSFFLAQLLKKYNNNVDKSLHFYNNGYKGTNTRYVGKVRKHLTNIQLASYTK